MHQLSEPKNLSDWEEVDNPLILHNTIFGDELVSTPPSARSSLVTATPGTESPRSLKESRPGPYVHAGPVPRRQAQNGWLRLVYVSQNGEESSRL